MKVYAIIKKATDDRYYANLHFISNEKIWMTTQMYTQKHNCIRPIRNVGIKDIRDQTGDKNSKVAL